MTNKTLAQSYRIKAESRLKILPVLMAEQAYSDVVRESQEIVELALKGMLRQVGVEPPKWHDVGGALQEFSERFPAAVRDVVERLAEISAWLRHQTGMPRQQLARAAAQRGSDPTRCSPSGTSPSRIAPRRSRSPPWPVPTR